MDSNSGPDVIEVERILPVRRSDGRPEAPPSSYGSMRSDGRPEAPPSSYGSMRSDEEEEDEDITEDGASLSKPEIPGTTYGHTLLQLNRSESPETLWTEVTRATRRRGAYFTDGKPEGCVDEMDEAVVEEVEEVEEGEDSPPQADSPEPSLEEEAWSEQPGKHAELGQLHLELDIPFIFKTIQSSLLSLSGWELYHYKRNLCGENSPFTMENLEECDSLDLVDKILEAYGKGDGLRTAIRVFEHIKRPDLAQDLETKCKRAVVQYDLRCFLIRKHNIIHEGVPRAGQQLYLHRVYVEPQISTRGRGGLLPFHPVRPHPLPAPQPASPDSFIGGNAIFRPSAGSPAVVRTVLTTGLPGIGCTVAVQKFIMDWSKDRANRDIQFIFKLRMKELWMKREEELESGQPISFLELVRYCYTEVDSANFLDRPDCRALYILEGWDMYKTQLDFKNTRVVSDVCEAVSLDALLVNLIRGSLLPHSLVWITGRRAAITHIPNQLLHRLCEIQGFSDAMKDEFLTKRYTDRALAGQILEHVKMLPMLYALCHMPFMCWMVAMVFERCFRNNEHYGGKAPKLTPFYVHFLIIQTNRKLERYYGASHNNQNWTDADRDFVMKLGKMALRLLEKNRCVFYEEDMREQSLNWEEVAVYSGLCTELPAEDSCSPDRRRFCFVHYTFLEFIAAMYVFLSFRLEGKIVLDHSLRMPRLLKERALVDLLRSAVDRALGAPYGQYELFLRFLCGLALRVNDNTVLRGLLFPYNSPLLKGLEEGAKLLHKRKETAPPERHNNFDECIRELTQKDD